jgi:hypothetical protein
MYDTYIGGTLPHMYVCITPKNQKRAQSGGCHRHQKNHTYPHFWVIGLLKSYKMGMSVTRLRRQNFFYTATFFHSTLDSYLAVDDETTPNPALCNSLQCSWPSFPHSWCLLGCQHESTTTRRSCCWCADGGGGNNNKVPNAEVMQILTDLTSHWNADRFLFSTWTPDILLQGKLKQ